MNRLSRTKALDQVVVATTVERGDDAIVDLCRERSWAHFQGSEEDVLDRYYRAAREYEAEVVVRITSDCPLIEPQVVDRVVLEFEEQQPAIDYASNTSPRRTFPRGLDTEVMHFDSLARAWREDDNPASREHVTPYIWRHPELFQLHGVANDEDLSHMRWTVDTPEDLAFVRRIYDHFGHDWFSWRDVLGLLERHSEWTAINRDVEQKAI
jgi:spore coat polysaccharide biosynthesis protein SpsF